jgi:hypothetical protein
MAANLRKLEAAAWPIFEAGHVPMIGEWVALPVLHSAGVTAMDSLADDVLYPTAQRLLQHCDAVLRLPGESTGGSGRRNRPAARASCLLRHHADPRLAAPERVGWGVRRACSVCWRGGPARSLPSPADRCLAGVTCRTAMMLSKRAGQHRALIGTAGVGPVGLNRATRASYVRHQQQVNRAGL